MKKLITLLLALLLVLSIAIPTFAITPKPDVPKVTVPKLIFQMDLTDMFRNYWAQNPIKWR